MAFVMATENEVFGECVEDIDASVEMDYAGGLLC